MEVTVAKEDKTRDAKSYDNDEDEQALIEEAKNTAVDDDKEVEADKDALRKKKENDDKSLNASQLLEQAGIKKPSDKKAQRKKRK